MGAQEPAYRSVRVLLLTPAIDDSAGYIAGVLRGARFGAEEAARTAALTGGRYHFSHASVSDSPWSRVRALADSAQIIISALPLADLLALFPNGNEPLTLDVSPWVDPRPCQPRILHLSPGAAALEETRAWHPALERFGAQQLNERYRRYAGRTLDGDAWTGWLAAKLAYEIPLRARSSDADSMAAFARSARARFDGHKGRALAFDTDTGVLDQPLYRGTGAPPDQKERAQPAASCRRSS